MNPESLLSRASGVWVGITELVKLKSRCEISWPVTRSLTVVSQLAERQIQDSDLGHVVLEPMLNHSAV